MQTRKLFLALILAISSLSARSQDITIPAEGNNTFAFELFKQILQKDKNGFISPYSISSAMTMAWAGARGETQKQMSNVLHLDPDPNMTLQGFYALTAKVNEAAADSGVVMNVANSLWIKRGFDVNPTYPTITEQYFKAPVKELTTAADVNNWVNHETHGKITDLVDDKDVVKSVMMIANAIYFKGSWQSPFNGKNTHKQKFTTAANLKVDADMMSQNLKVNYYEDDKKQALELPYKNGKISMMIVLPKVNGSLAGMLTTFGAPAYREIQANFRSQEVDISLPKFSFGCENELSDVLSKMGMTDAFYAPAADFTGIAQKLFIGVVKHKAIIEVNEQGSEAAAATAVGMVTSIREPQVTKFTADNPFIFLIKENESNVILFMGTVENPNLKE
jgi:serpin B